MPAYSIVVDDAGRFAVKSRTTGKAVQVGNGFITEAKAQQRIDEKQRHNDLGNDFA